MRFGLNTFLYVSPFVTDSVKLFPKFKKWGFDTLELPIEDPSHIDAVAVRKAADKVGIAIGTLCAAMGPGRDFRGTPGGDHIDWKPIVKALRKIDYKGDVVIESFTTDVKVIARAAAIWRKMEPNRDDISRKGLANLKKFFKKKK